MQHNDYVQLVKNSDVFKALDGDMQKQILKADGEQQARYEQIFVTERNGIAAAKREMMESNERVLANFETDTKKTKRDFVRTTEVKERASEADKADDLLNSL